jgi:hypothetical protein
VQFVPPFVHPGDPDYDKIRARVAAALDPAEPGPAASSGSGDGADGGSGSGPGAGPGSGGSQRPGSSAPGDAVSLSTACRYS